MNDVAAWPPSRRSPRFIATIGPPARLVPASTNRSAKRRKRFRLAGNEVNAGSASTRRSVRSSRQRAYKLGSAQRKINGMDRWMKFRGVFLRHRSPPLAAMDRVKISAWMCFKFSSRCPAGRSLRRVLYLSLQPARTAASSPEMLNGVHRISLVVRRVPFEYRA